MGQAATESGPDSKLRRRAILFGLITSWIGAGTFLVAKKATVSFEPLDLGWFRIMMSFIVVGLIAYRREGRRLLPERKHIPALVAMGLLGITANQMLFIHGIFLAAPIDGAMIYALTPLAVMIASRFLLGESLTWRKIVGILVALAGATCVLKARGFDLQGDHFRGDMILILAMLAWAAYTLIGKRMMGTYSALTVNFWAFGVGALSMVPLTPTVLFDFDWAGPGLAGWLGLGYLSAITSVLSFNLWTYALKILDATQVAVFSNLQPAITALLAWIFLSQVPTAMVVVGMIFIIAGVWLTQIRPAPKFVVAQTVSS